MGWTTPNHTFVTGELFTASLGNTYIRDQLDYLKTERDASVRVLHYNVTPVGNVGTGVDTLMTWDLPADTLIANGQAIRITWAGSFANNANNNRNVSSLFGATTLTSLTLSTFVGNNNDRWGGQVTIARISGTVQEVSGDAYARVAGLEVRDCVLCVNGTPGETLSGPVTIKCTGTSTIGTDNDIVQTMLLVEAVPIVGI